MTAPIRRLEQNEALDGLVTALAERLPPWVVGGSGRRLLSGEWLGHALHPLLTDLPIGFWTNASVLDIVGRGRHADAARVLVGLGILSAVPTAAAGLSDWSRLDPPDRRVGLVHAQLNSVALALYGVSFLQRRRGGRHGRRHAGVVSALLGAVVATAGGWLGGHLVADRAVTRDNRLFDTPPAPVVDVHGPGGTEADRGAGAELGATAEPEADAAAPDELAAPSPLPPPR